MYFLLDYKSQNLVIVTFYNQQLCHGGLSLQAFWNLAGAFSPLSGISPIIKMDLKFR